MEGSRGYPSTDEMQHLAEMLQGKIELVDLEEPASPMTTYGEEGPVLFRIAHQNIAQDPTDTCDHWVLIDLGPSARKEARLRMETLERFNGKRKPRVSLRNTKAPHPPGSGQRLVQRRSRMSQMDVQKSRLRKVAIERHNRNAAELSRHYIEWHHTYLECKDCGCRSKEENFKLMTEAQCEWHLGMLPPQRNKGTKRRFERRAHATKQCTTIRDGATAFTWLVQSATPQQSERPVSVLSAGCTLCMWPAPQGFRSRSYPVWLFGSFWESSGCIFLRRSFVTQYPKRDEK